MTTNTLRERLRARDRMTCTLLGVASPEMVEIAGHAGFVLRVDGIDCILPGPFDYRMRLGESPAVEACIER